MRFAKVIPFTPAARSQAAAGEGPSAGGEVTGTSLAANAQLEPTRASSAQAPVVDPRAQHETWAPTGPEIGPQAQLASLIDAAVGGDARAAQALLLRVLSRVRNLIRYLVRGEDVDDLTQDVLLKVLERLPSYRGEGRFEAWVDAITLRVTLRGIGKRRLDRWRFSRDMPEDPPAPSGPAPSPRQLASKRAVEALDHLPAAQRVALVMHHVLGMTVHEIADEVDAPGETVRSRLRVGMRQLRERLGLGEEEP